MSLLRKAIALKEKSAAPPVRQRRDANELLSTIENIYHIKDLDSLLESILYEARKFVYADAGPLYIVSDGRLHFSYVQNDTLFPAGNSRDKYLSESSSMPVDQTSIAGYAALTGEALLIDDVYDIHSGVSYSFNPSFDRKSSYRTKSILVVPLLTRDGTILGVLQLINALSPDGEAVPFSMQDRLYISQFAQSAANAIETARLSREMVLRLVEMVELRDPFETGYHVKRVGAFSVELYEAWAKKHGLAAKEINNTKDMLRTSAMLHDLGKVAVSDIILKKPAELTEEERKQVCMHTIYGARTFRRMNSDWDKTAEEVILNHHERWDGAGYPGRIPDVFATKIEFGPGKHGTEIPLAARIVAIADNFDALISKRSYKNAWSEEEVYAYLRSQSGKFFDPELVEIFLSIKDVVRAIRNKFVDHSPDDKIPAAG